MSDRELLESAAKAAGLTVSTRDQAIRDEFGAGDAGLWIIGTSTCWNPLTDDGDCARLAVKLRMDVSYVGAATIQARAGDGPIATEYVSLGEDHYAATRRAIVRAAAAMGEPK